MSYDVYLFHAGFLQQLQLWQEMGYVFKPDHPGYNLVTMRQLAMRYDAGEELASITANLAVPSESTTQVDMRFALCLFQPPQTKAYNVFQMCCWQQLTTDCSLVAFLCHELKHNMNCCTLWCKCWDMPLL